MTEANIYDYVIVGAGSAGCVLANRLSADPSIRVCLIEAGEADRHPLIHIPIGVVSLLTHHRLNWRYATTPQAQLDGREIPIPRGKVLGGSSSINGMVYNRGHPADYDNWAAMGNSGWAWDDVLPYFRRSENNEIWGETEFHGIGGPMNVTNLDLVNPLDRVFLAAADSLQFSRTPDFNGAQPEGFGMRQVTMRKGRRESAATAFLKPCRERGNLDVVTGAVVSRVVLEGGRAIAVELTGGAGARRIAARSEIILSAGAVASPMILMRSGIGEPDALARHGIQPVLALPEVGSNLRDHVSAAVQFESPGSESFGLSWRAAPWLAWNVAKYALLRKGLLASNGINAAGFVRTEPGLDQPDIQLIFIPARRDSGGRVGRGHGFTLTAILLHPKSSGRVSLSGPAADAAPIIDANFLADPDDLPRLLRGVKLARRLLNAPAFNPYRGTEQLPGAAVQTDADLSHFIRRTAATAFHPVGTCRMGIDGGAVVDPRLRVRGIGGLRVVDASIFPTQIGGNTNAPVIMVAEKAADIILAHRRAGHAPSAMPPGSDGVRKTARSNA